MEIDHIFICTNTKAPSGDLLKEFGLIEGSPNTHPGQGTANRRFYFHNLMLELLWVENIDEVQSERTKPMRLFERCLLRTDEISPFGIGFRPPTMEHIVPLKEITSVRIHVNQDIDLSEAACVLNQLNNLSIIKGKEHLIEIEFDNRTLDEFRDFRPALPLLFRW